MLLGKLSFLIIALVQFCSTAIIRHKEQISKKSDECSDIPSLNINPHADEVLPPCSCSRNSPEDRSVWYDRDIYTDYEEDWPDTGVEREYVFEVTEEILAPDGFKRSALAVNGGIPGPTIHANWGDWIVVHVIHNISETKISAPGLTIHWHGITQWRTNIYDGVSSMTQCPIAQYRNMTYRWQATQYGTAWYHAHLGLEAWDGVFGGIVINGPASANYDEDKGVVFVHDWTHVPSQDAYTSVELFGPPTIANGLINGKNVWSTEDDSHGCPSVAPFQTLHCFFRRQQHVGERFSMTMERGKTYRLRLVNSAIDNNFRFQIDGHNLTIIAMDLVPVQPYVTSSVNIFMGQRYDVLVTAGQDDGPFWIRSIPLMECSGIYKSRTTLGILYYGKNDKTIPNTRPLEESNVCEEMPTKALKPIIEKNVPPVPKNAPFIPGHPCSPGENGCDSASFQINTTINAPGTDSAFYKWRMNGQDMTSVWGAPTIKLLDDTSAIKQPRNIYVIPEEKEWVYFMFNNPNNLINGTNSSSAHHPMHFHGHDFYILAQGHGDWNESNVNLVNPPRRDSAMLYGGNGYLLIAWKANNPGVWLLHCHIGWHTSMGFDLQVIEKRQEALKHMDLTVTNRTCDEYEDWAHRFSFVQSATWDTAGV